MPLNILLTGFGPFADYTVNASWEAIVRGVINKCRPVVVHDNNSEQAQIVNRIKQEIRPMTVEAVYLSVPPKSSTTTTTTTTVTDTTDTNTANTPTTTNNTEFVIYCVQFSVVYEEAQRMTPALLKLIDPVYCIHCGVGHKEAVKLERFGYNSSFTQFDVVKCVPDNNICIENGPESLETCLPLEILQQAVTNQYTVKKSEELQRETNKLAHNDKNGGDESNNSLVGAGQDDKSPIIVNCDISTNPGRYLCCFLYYYSLYLSKGKNNCLFVHVPPIGFPYSVECLGDTIFTIVSEICQLHQ